MDFSWFNQIMQNELAQQIIYDFVKCAAATGIDSLRGKIRKIPEEQQMMDCLEKAFEKTCRELEWEHDSNAIAETFIEAHGCWGSIHTTDSLKTILESATGQDVTGQQVMVWAEQLKRQFVADEHSMLFKYLQLIHIFDANNNQYNYSKARRILTPAVSIWQNINFTGREAEMNELKEKIRNRCHIQLTGMGGIGKTEILRRLYSELIEDPSIDHIAYLSYNGSIDEAFINQLEYDGDGVNDAWRHIQNLAAHCKLIILVDDVTATNGIVMLQHEKENDLNKLCRLQASVVFASRQKIACFEDYPIHSLLPEQCIRLFEKGYGEAVSIDNRSLLAELMEKRAGCNTLVVQRLGIIANEYGWDILTLDSKLKARQFCIKYNMPAETLQREIDKLYRIESLDDGNPNNPERSILEAFAIWPSIPLSKETCGKWLCADAGLEEDDIYRILNMLAKKTWLEKRTVPSPPIAKVSISMLSISPGLVVSSGCDSVPVAVGSVVVSVVEGVAASSNASFSGCCVGASPSSKLLYIFMSGCATV